MGKVLELSEETYQQLADLAQRQQRTVEDMLRLCLAAYEEALYERAHQQMLAEGVLVSMPAPPLLPGRRRKATTSSPWNSRASRSPRSFWKTGANARPVRGYERPGQTLRR